MSPPRSLSGVCPSRNSRQHDARAQGAGTELVRRRRRRKPACRQKRGPLHWLRPKRTHEFDFGRFRCTGCGGRLRPNFWSNIRPRDPPSSGLGADKFGANSAATGLNQPSLVPIRPLVARIRPGDRPNLDRITHGLASTNFELTLSNVAKDGLDRPPHRDRAALVARHTGFGSDAASADSAVSWGARANRAAATHGVRRSLVCCNTRNACLLELGQVARSISPTIAKPLNLGKREWRSS